MQEGGCREQQGRVCLNQLQQPMQYRIVNTWLLGATGISGAYLWRVCGVSSGVQRSLQWCVALLRHTAHVDKSNYWFTTLHQQERLKQLYMHAPVHSVCIKRLLVDCAQ